MVIDERRPGEVVRAVEWAEIRALAKDGVLPAEDRSTVGDQSRDDGQALASDAPRGMCERRRGRS